MPLSMRLGPEDEKYFAHRPSFFQLAEIGEPLSVNIWGLLSPRLDTLALGKGPFRWGSCMHWRRHLIHSVGLRANRRSAHISNPDVLLALAQCPFSLHASFAIDTVCEVALQELYMRSSEEMDRIQVRHCAKVDQSPEQSLLAFAAHQSRMPSSAPRKRLSGSSRPKSHAVARHQSPRSLLLPSTYSECIGYFLP